MVQSIVIRYQIAFNFTQGIFSHDLSIKASQGMPPGIVPDECNPGFLHYRIQPRPAGSLLFVRCGIRTPYGGIHVSWHRTETEFFLSLTQPAECCATIVLPDGSFREARLPHGEWCCRLSSSEGQDVFSAALTQISRINPESGALYSNPGLH